MIDFTPDPIRDYIRVSTESNRFRPPLIETFTPSPTKLDRNLGEIQRYFVKFTTHSDIDIIEVDKPTFTRLSINPTYRTTSIKWLISGPLDDLPDKVNTTKLTLGVISMNKKSVELGNEDLPGLKNFIVDFKRFWQF
jgi:hypothetical protein